MMRRAALSLLVILIVGYAPTIEAVPSRQTLVLAAAPGLDIPRLQPDEIRSLFMGAPVVKQGVRLRPLLNESDPLLREVFLQKVMFVSWKHYQRRLVEEAFRQGWPLPETVSNPHRLVRALALEPGAITYMWQDVAQQSNVEVVQTLWSGPVD